MTTTLVNNTGKDISMFVPMLNDCVKKSIPLPEDFSDIFFLNIIEVEGKKRGIVSFA